MTQTRKSKSALSACVHPSVACLNQHELIRKYRCSDCGGIMMCACDEAFGRRFLSHQLGHGRELETAVEVPVTLGFQQGICNPCRGLPAMAAPAAEGYGRTSKIKRYYWRELFFAERVRQADWSDAHPDAGDDERAAAFKQIEADVLEEVKAEHRRAPRYQFSEPSQAEILARHAVDIEALAADYVELPEKGAVIAMEGRTVSVEAYVRRHYEAQGWSAIDLESRPFHALFGVLMWMLIEDPADSKGRMVGYGSRTAFEQRTKGEMIWAIQPEDFGTAGYGKRRARAIRRHFDQIVFDRDELLWLFDYWRPYSEALRQYLWAHNDSDVDRARRLIEILPPATIRAILDYLVADYWGRYLGWPDMLLWRGDDILMIEVKSSSDRLSGDQKNWIADNATILKLPFRIVKVHRRSGARRTKD